MSSVRYSSCIFTMKFAQTEECGALDSKPIVASRVGSSFTVDAGLKRIAGAGIYTTNSRTVVVSLLGWLFCALDPVGSF